MTTDHTIFERIRRTHRHTYRQILCVFRFYGPVNPMGSCRARSVYLTTRLLGRLSPIDRQIDRFHDSNLSRHFAAYVDEQLICSWNCGRDIAQTALLLLLTIRIQCFCCDSLSFVRFIFFLTVIYYFMSQNHSFIFIFRYLRRAVFHDYIFLGYLQFCFVTWACLCWGSTVHLTQWGHVERGQIT